MGIWLEISSLQIASFPPPTTCYDTTTTMHPDPDFMLAQVHCSHSTLLLISMNAAHRPPRGLPSLPDGSNPSVHPRRLHSPLSLPPPLHRITQHSCLPSAPLPQRQLRPVRRLCMSPPPQPVPALGQRWTAVRSWRWPVSSQLHCASRRSLATRRGRRGGTVCRCVSLRSPHRVLRVPADSVDSCSLPYQRVPPSSPCWPARRGIRLRCPPST